MDNVAAIILAAGKASRFRAADPQAATKVVALYQGEPMVRRAVQAALDAGCSPVVVVTGCEADVVRNALVGLDITFAHNAMFERGIASSLITGVSALPANTKAAFVMLGDMPMVSSALLQSIATALRASPHADAIVPVHEGQRGNPALLSRSLFAAARELSGDQGARRLLQNPALTVIELEADASAAVDIDTLEALLSLASGEKSLEFTIHYDEPVLRQAVATFVQRRVMRGMGPSGLLALGITFTALIYLHWQEGSSWLTWMLGGLLLVFAIIVFGAWRLRLAQVLRKLAAIPSRRANVRLKKDSIIIAAESGTVDLPWSGFTELWTEKDFWLLFLAPNNFITIPTRDVPQEALDFIAAHLNAVTK